MLAGLLCDWCANTTGTENCLSRDGVMALLAPVLMSMPQMTSLHLGGACSTWGQPARQGHGVPSLCGLVPHA